eukprot:354064-Chlamydomonas_euryale.AAC.4
MPVYQCFCGVTRPWCTASAVHCVCGVPLLWRNTGWTRQRTNADLDLGRSPHGVAQHDQQARVRQCRVQAACRRWHVQVVWRAVHVGSGWAPAKRTAAAEVAGRASAARLRAQHAAVAEAAGEGVGGVTYGDRGRREGVGGASAHARALSSTRSPEMDV